MDQLHTKLLLLSIIFLISGCASNPDKIEAVYVTPDYYAKYDCDKLSREKDRVDLEARVLYESLKDERKADNAQMAVGLVLFWPALLWLEGGDGPEARDYALLKGEKIAIEKAAVEKDCTL